MGSPFGRSQRQVEARCPGVPIDMGGRDGLACGKPLPRWGRRVPFSRRDTAPWAAGLDLPAVFLYFQEPALGIPSIKKEVLQKQQPPLQVSGLES